MQRWRIVVLVILFAAPIGLLVGVALRSRRRNDLPAPREVSAPFHAVEFCAEFVPGFYRMTTDAEPHR